VLYGSSPYYAGTARGQVNWDVNLELGATPQPRGKMISPTYKRDRTRIRGARRRMGAPRICGGPPEAAGILGRFARMSHRGDDPERCDEVRSSDWLNGRAKGYTTLTGSEEVKRRRGRREKSA